MKRYKDLAALLLLCALFLSACGTSKSQDSSQDGRADTGGAVTAPPAGGADAGSAATSLPAGGADGTRTDNMAPCVEPLYDPRSNSLTLTDLASNTVLASYPFEEGQYVLSAESVNDGVVALAAAETEDANSDNQGNVIIQGVDSDEKITVYRFDQQLHLRDSFRLEDPGLPDGLISYPLAVSRDGSALTWVQEDGIYRYVLETGDLEQVPLKLPEAVCFDRIRYSEDGKKLFYFGGNGQEDVTVYGALDAETGKGTLFYAEDFDASSITVTGDYAVVNAAVPPGASDGNGRILLIDSIAGTGSEITLKSEGENDLAAAAADGKTLITCAAADGKGGVLRFYDTASSELKSEQPYSCEQEGIPYLLLVREQTAQVVLRTAQGFVLSVPVALP